MKAWNFIKKRLTTRLFSCEYSKNFKNSIFIEQLWWLLLHYVLVSEKNLRKKKVSGKIAFDLISLFHV